MDWRRFFSGIKLTSTSTTESKPAPDARTRLSLHLSEAVQIVAGPLPDAQAAHYLHTVAAHDLIDIDARLRAVGFLIFEKWPPDMLDSINTSDLDDEERQSQLFIACSHYRGQDRQAAVHRLVDHPGTLTLAAGLIRSTDWAPQVRAAAREAVTQLLPLCRTDDIVAVWPLVLRLQQRERGSDGWLANSIEAMLLRPDCGSFLRLARQSQDNRVRYWAYRHSILTDNVALAEAVAQPEPQPGLYALRHARETLSSEAITSLASTGLRASNPIIRRECLRALAHHDAAATAAHLPRALLDRSSGVRSLATHLATGHGIDPRMIWRRALINRTDGIHAAALASLADNPDAEDIVLFRHCLSDERQVIRHHAVRGLLRLKQALSPEDLARLFDLGGNRVMNTLHSAISDDVIALDAGLIATIMLHLEPGTSGRARLRRALGLASLWDRLTRLMTLHLTSADQQWWHTLVDDWIAQSTHYTPLLEGRKQELLRMMRKRSIELGEARISAIESSLNRY